MRQGMGIAIACLLLLAGMGCNQDQGTIVTDADAAKVKADLAASVEKQIADVQKNDKIAPRQKQMIINNIRAGAARAQAGSQSGQGAGKPQTR